MDAVKAVAAGLLKNPDSAKFRNVTIDNQTGVVCGYINGTNAMGGYAGEMKFVGADDMVYLVKLPDDGANPAGTAAYNVNCD